MKFKVLCAPKTLSSQKKKQHIVTNLRLDLSEGRQTLELDQELKLLGHHVSLFTSSDLTYYYIAERR
jgi:predicted Zn-dependent peptidase